LQHIFAVRVQGGRQRSQLREFLDFGVQNKETAQTDRGQNQHSDHGEHKARNNHFADRYGSEETCIRHERMSHLRNKTCWHFPMSHPLNKSLGGARAQMGRSANWCPPKGAFFGVFWG
jgi:hypothetical protein